jgi:hypothetical protein
MNKFIILIFSVLFCFSSCTEQKGKNIQKGLESMGLENYYVWYDCITEMDSNAKINFQNEYIIVRSSDFSKGKIYKVKDYSVYKKIDMMNNVVDCFLEITDFENRRIILRINREIGSENLILEFFEINNITDFINGQLINTSDYILKDDGIKFKKLN